VLNNEPIQANDQLFYFANPKDELEICFEERKPRETLLVLFDRSMVYEAADAWERSPEYLLEHPFGDSREALDVPPVPFSYTNQFRASLRELCDGEGQMRHQVLSQFIGLNSDLRRTINGVPAEKASTRQEIYKRLALARAYMESNLDVSLTIEQIAREALLNRFYFLTTFKSVFGVTPHEYLRQKKMERAYQLLSLGYSVTDVCQSVGYQSLGSFTNLFKKTFGCTPSKVAEDGT
jgi:AraC-like DNA-binding protein